MNPNRRVVLIGYDVEKRSHLGDVRGRRSLDNDVNPCHALTQKIAYIAR